MFFLSDFQVLVFVWTIFTMVEMVFQGLPGWAAIGLALLLGALALTLALLRRSHRRPSADDPALAARVTAITRAIDQPGLEVAIVTAKVPFLALKRGRVEVSPQMGALLNDQELRAMLLQALAKAERSRRRTFFEFTPGGLVVLAGIALSVYTGSPYASLLFPLAYLGTIVMSRMLLLQTGMALPDARRFMELGGDPVALGSALVKLYQQAGDLARGLSLPFRAQVLACLALKPELQQRLNPLLVKLAPPVRQGPPNLIAWGLALLLNGAITLILLLQIL